MQPEDEEPTEEELKEAAELARALDRGTAQAPPEDALAAAALVRFAKDGGALSPERSREILDEALRAARPEKARARRWTGFFAALGLSLAAAAVVLAVRLRGPEAPLPAPPPALVTAEIAAARPGGAALAALAVEMREYRGRVYATLEERYRR